MEAKAHPDHRPTTRRGQQRASGLIGGEVETTMRPLRTVLLLAAATFVAAAAIHSGALLEGYRHHEARTAETVIAIALLGGFASTWARPGWARRAAIGTQAFALLGVLVGLFTIAIGVGPRTAPDVAYHVAILAVLGAGLALAVRMPGR